MNLVKKIIAGTAFAAVLSLITTVAVQAAVLTMKPLQAVSFDVEAKHAVSYFLNDNGTCKLVLTLGETPNADDVTNSATTRFETAVDAGKTTRFAVTTGKSLDFACQAGAQAMAVIGLEQIHEVPTREISERLSRSPVVTLEGGPYVPPLSSQVNGSGRGWCCSREVCLSHCRSCFEQCGNYHSVGTVTGVDLARSLGPCSVIQEGTP